MQVTVLPLYRRGKPLGAAACDAGSMSGFISVTREPGGRLGAWARTALLFRQDPSNPESSVDLLSQIHDVRLGGWDASGVLLIGIEREYRRKDCSTYPSAWLVPVPGGGLVDIYPLRHAGGLRPRDEVRASTPIAGVINAQADDGGRLMVSLRDARGGQCVVRSLRSAQLQRWESRGLVIAGHEVDERTPGDPLRQSWFIRVQRRMSGAIRDS